MKCYVKTKYGESYEISELTKTRLTALLLKSRDKVPQFVELIEAGVTINTDSIAVIGGVDTW